MAAKPKIFLIDFRGYGQHDEAGQHFRIERMVGTIHHKAGKYLRETQVKDMIDVLNWDVTIRAPKDSDF